MFTHSEQRTGFAGAHRKPTQRSDNRSHHPNAIPTRGHHTDHKTDLDHQTSGGGPGSMACGS
ncbi:hypothetical protein A4G27_01160 [Mycobacterium kansasii]|nr:hypothetical protein A4G27_01160 [Mycobacterium kansasii]